MTTTADQIAFCTTLAQALAKFMTRIYQKSIDDTLADEIKALVPKIVQFDNGGLLEVTNMLMSFTVMDCKVLIGREELQQAAMDRAADALAIVAKHRRHLQILADQRAA